ncbi:hypothetical protein [uncultured Desulfobacter sp.]|uniref:hypothetical protein n=1 Tax=uncultured Desulfobacter sp. TaxID=240139 RepID=UPI002AA60302|nr:hypothetical protein [uncultured Desulfobacter sp.]
MTKLNLHQTASINQADFIDRDSIRYAIAKQTSTIESINTAYGEIELDDELKRVIQDAVEMVLCKRLGERQQITIEPVEIADVQMESIDKMVDLTGKSAGSLVQLMFDHGFETWDSLARLVEPE